MVSTDAKTNPEEKTTMKKLSTLAALALMLMPACVVVAWLM